MITSSLVPTTKGPKNVLILSTVEPLQGVTKDDGKKKPSIFKLYDFTKAGTDVVDPRIGKYSTKTKSPKWPWVCFNYVLDTIQENASTVLCKKLDVAAKDIDLFELG